MSQDGKPIWVDSTQSDTQIARICAFVQALHTNVGVNLGSPTATTKIHHLKSRDHSITFMLVEPFTIVVIGPSDVSFVHLRLRMEYLFAQVIATLTDHVQIMYRQNPTLDLTSLLASTHFSQWDGIPNHLWAVPTFFPLHPELRQRLGQAIVQTCHDALFALLLMDSQVVTLVQPALYKHQLQTTDIRLLIRLVSQHQQYHSAATDAATEDASNCARWIPICLPHLHASGFLYCLVCKWACHRFALILISAEASMEQFQRLQHQAKTVQSNMSEWVRFARSPSSQAENTTLTPAHDDYVNVSHEDDTVLPHHLGLDSTFQHTTVSDKIPPLENDWYQTQHDILQEYRTLAKAKHFSFRWTASTTGVKGGRLVQFIDSANHIGEPVEAVDWTTTSPTLTTGASWEGPYQQLALRLRLGSTTIEASLDAFDIVQQPSTAYRPTATSSPSTKKASQNDHRTIAQECPAMAFLDASPSLQGVCYIATENETYLAMNGPDFELYVLVLFIVFRAATLIVQTRLTLMALLTYSFMTTPASIPPERVATLGAKLTRQILQDHGTLFIVDLLTWAK